MSGNGDRMELSEEAQQAIKNREVLLRGAQMESKARMLIVPTVEQEVKKMLRSLGEPITLFGETAVDRRDRLKQLVAHLQEEHPELGLLFSSMSVDAIQPQRSSMEAMAAAATQESLTGEQGVQFTDASEELKRARLYIAGYSLPRAQQRLEKQQQLKKQLEDSKTFVQEGLKRKKTLFKTLKKISIGSSQVGDTRPLSTICAIPLNASSLHTENQKMVVLTGSFTGQIKAWNAPECRKLATFRGHDDRITGLAFHPQVDSQTLEPLFTTTAADQLLGSLPTADNDIQNTASKRLAFASGSADGTAKLWSMSDPMNPLHTLVGHSHRLCRIAFHPSGKFLGTTSYDGTWRLWDVNELVCLLEQDGHSRGVYGIAFQCDGALVATSDIGGEVRLWDLRTGKTVMPLAGHARQVLSVDFSPNGFQLASGGDDNCVRIWDLRKQKCIYTLAAHSKTISSVKYEPLHGRYLVSSAYDKTLKIWRNVDFKLVNTLEGHDGLVMCCDICKSDDEDLVVSSSYDRTWKLWKVDEFMNL